MFTGIIEELGTIVELSTSGTSLCLKIEAERIFSERAETPPNGVKIGDSIAVNGVCLTVTQVQPHMIGQAMPYFEVTAIAETLGKTTLSSLTAGQRINLERAATLETRLGGHLVQGHVDGVVVLRSIRDVNGSWEFSFELGRLEALPHAIVPKGSIAIDGISLTVAGLSANGERRTANEAYMESEESKKLATRHSPLATELRVAIIPTIIRTFSS
jgi:riboflavin synthase